MSTPISVLLRRILQDDAFRESFERDRKKCLATCPITADEREAMLSLDVRKYLASSRTNGLSRHIMI